MMLSIASEMQFAKSFMGLIGELLSTAACGPVVARVGSSICLHCVGLKCKLEGCSKIRSHSPVRRICVYGTKYGYRRGILCAVGKHSP